jgi:hypothetical protein
MKPSGLVISRLEETGETDVSTHLHLCKDRRAHDFGKMSALNLHVLATLECSEATLSQHSELVCPFNTSQSVVGTHRSLKQFSGELPFHQHLWRHWWNSSVPLTGRSSTSCTLRYASHHTRVHQRPDNLAIDPMSPRFWGHPNNPTVLERCRILLIAPLV